MTLTGARLLPSQVVFLLVCREVVLFQNIQQKKKQMTQKRQTGSTSTFVSDHNNTLTRA